MKTKLFLSMLVILVAIVATVGGTMAWFTDTAEITTNTFTAGTVILDADDVFDYTGGLKNWNPGDCTPKEVTVIYKGSKKAYIRVLIEEEWTDLDVNVDGYNGPASISTQERDFANVIWKNEDSELWDFGEWQIVYDGTNYWWYYYQIVDGSYPAEDPDNPVNWTKINVLSEVCLTGSETGNEYQGATYTIDMQFEAIQASHEAVFDEWGVGLVNGSWVEVSFNTTNERWESDNHYWDDEADVWNAI